MPLPKLSPGAKAALSNVLMALLVIGAIGTSIVFNRQQIATADRIHALSDLTSRQLPELMLDVKNIQTNVAKVQQFLTDVSATHAQDGLDDGFEEAAKNAKELGERIVAVRTLAKKLGADNVIQAIDQVEAAFGSHYEIGQKMAEAYAAAGAAGGRKVMPEFDKGSAALGGSMASLMTAVENLSRHGQAKIEQETVLAATQSRTLSYLLYALGAASLLIAALAFLLTWYGVAKPLNKALLSQREQDRRLNVSSRAEHAEAQGRPVAAAATNTDKLVSNLIVSLKSTVAGDRRSDEPRVATDLPGQVKSGSDILKGTIVNLSHRGALFRTDGSDQAVVEGGTVAVDLGAIGTVLASIVAKSSGGLHLQFKEMQDRVGDRLAPLIESVAQADQKVAGPGPAAPASKVLVFEAEVVSGGSSK
jgi:hypothetical protein